MKWMHASTSVLAIAAMAVTLTQGGTKGVIEAEGFRVVSNGKKSWEVVPIDGGTQMTFFVDGREACYVVAQGDVVTLVMKAGTTRSDVIVGKNMFAESVACGEGKETAVMSRRIVMTDAGLRANHDVQIGGSTLSIGLDASALTTFARCGRNTTRLELAEKKAQLVAAVPDDLDVDIQVGGPPWELKGKGNIVKGFEVLLTRKKQEWAWSSK
jgi:hypothetical protein